MPQIRSTVSSNVTAGPRPLWQRALLFSAAYFLCAKAGSYLSVQNSPYLSFWLPSGLFVGVLLLSETREWVWLALAVLPANLLFDLLKGTPAAAIFFFYLANVVQSVAGAWLVRRFVAERPRLDTIKEFAGLLGLAAILSTMLGAAVGAATVVGAGFSESFARSWEIWWGSTAMAVMILTPFLLTWFTGPATARSFFQQPRRVMEASVLIAALVLIIMDMLIFGGGINTPVKSRLLPLLLWAGIRFGLRGATAANLLLALLMGLFTTQFHKGLTAADLASGNYVLTMQTFVAVAALVGLIPAIALGERDRTLAELSKSEEKYSKVFRSSPAGVLLTEIETGRYIEVNESFCRLYGFTKEETIGQSSLNLGIFESDTERKLLIEPLRQHGFVRDLQLRTRARNGEVKIVIVNAELIKLEGRQCLLSVIYDITSRLATEERLARSRQQLRALLSRLQTLREEERTHIAREIHDHLGQLLTALKLDLRLIERKLVPHKDADTATPIQIKLNSAKLLVDETIDSVQKIASELRPAILDRLGLEAAIEVEARAFEARAHVQCQWEVPKTPLSTTSHQATAVFRIFQELLTNIARHSKATQVKVILSRRGNELVLEVQDDGVGMKKGDLENPNSLGLLGMQERAEILGGNILFGPGIEKGTSVTLLIPIQTTSV